MIECIAQSYEVKVTSLDSELDTYSIKETFGTKISRLRMNFSIDSKPDADFFDITFVQSSPSAFVEEIRNIINRNSTSSSNRYKSVATLFFSDGTYCKVSCSYYYSESMFDELLSILGHDDKKFSVLFSIGELYRNNVTISDKMKKTNLTGVSMFGKRVNFVNFSSIKAISAIVKKMEEREEHQTPGKTSANINQINGHEYVDMGLPSGTLWATCNIGANAPHEIGNYYGWGETLPKEYYGDNYFDLVEGCEFLKPANPPVFKKYQQNKLTEITPNSGNDTARENWGSPWRMPSKAEIEELCKYCKWEWITLSGQNGYKITGPNGLSIFLPASGAKCGRTLTSKNETGAYWSNALGYNSENACNLYISKKMHETSTANQLNLRFNGLNIRPVTDRFSIEVHKDAPKFGLG